MNIIFKKIMALVLCIGVLQSVYPTQTFKEKLIEKKNIITRWLYDYSAELVPAVGVIASESILFYIIRKANAQNQVSTKKITIVFLIFVAFNGLAQYNRIQSDLELELRFLQKQ
jgi:hypothetical protein